MVKRDEVKAVGGLQAKVKPGSVAEAQFQKGGYMRGPRDGKRRVGE